MNTSLDRRTGASRGPARSPGRHLCTGRSWILADGDPVALDTTYLPPGVGEAVKGDLAGDFGWDRRAGVAAIGIVAREESASVWRLLCLVVAEVVSLKLVQS